MNVTRHWLAFSPGHPATTNVVGDEADLPDYRAQNWIIQGPFVLEAEQLRGAVDTLRLIAKHARLDHAERGIAEAERYALLAEDALTHLGGQ